ncbi:putative nucleotidyltransferase-like protein [Neobacillus bataviensis]|uniref:Putative nucleotidyltransferase-like protein n=1 Tax=Neobacillus bataviensis TaxID=220685 RepID=A0A561D6B1_9BACI|nr:nucleotidyltransferase family protein [Neobacillus bataviensis]TWD98884.1 putative nucleotidyltransferase-like protein [Neobacillus bataviensis]
MSLEVVTLLYNQNTVMPQEEGFYTRSLLDIENEGISSQVFFILKQQGRLNQTPAFFQNRLKESYEKGMFQNLLIRNQMNTILTNFENQRIDVIPLKGVHFAENYFGHIGARTTSDIDLLIGLHDLNGAIEIIKNLGFTVEEEQVPGHFHCSFSKTIPGSTMPLVVEIHWNIVRENTSAIRISDLWDQAEQAGNFKHIKELSPNHLFYMICLHGWRHNLDSSKYFIDIIQLIYKLDGQIDYDYLLKIASSHKTLKRLKRTLSIVYHQFPHLHEVKELPFKIIKTKWEYQNIKGLNQYIDFVDYQLFSYDTVKHSLIELVNLIWPSKYELAAQIGREQKGKSLFRMYMTLYKKRLTSIFKVFLMH